MIYDYCNSNIRENLILSCEIKNLQKIHSYSLRNDEMQVAIFKCKNCNGIWKQTTFNNSTKWLQVGEATVNQEDYIPYDSSGYYPIEYFEIEEVYDYDNSIFCGHRKETKSYRGLTCSPKTLKLIEKTNEIEVIGWKTKTEIFVCSKCQTKWEITEEFDTQHGYAKTAKKI